MLHICPFNLHIFMQVLHAFAPLPFWECRQIFYRISNSIFYSSSLQSNHFYMFTFLSYGQIFMVLMLLCICQAYLYTYTSSSLYFICFAFWHRAGIFVPCRETHCVTSIYSCSEKCFLTERLSKLALSIHVICNFSQKIFSLRDGCWCYCIFDCESTSFSPLM